MSKIKVFSFLLAIGLLGGCASKDIVVDSKKTNNNKTVKQDEKSIDERVDRIVAQPVEPIQEEVIDEQSVDKDGNYINKTISIIDGEKVVLSSVHFKFDDYHLTDDMVTIANENSQKINKIKATKNSLKVKLEGNCDEWGTDEYNYALGLKRAKAVKKTLVENGFNKKDIVMVSYGESNPICNEHTLRCWKQNRRVDYKLLP